MQRKKSLVQTEDTETKQISKKDFIEFKVFYTVK